ncbi:MAG TPA: DUF2333 family protein [Desulfobaccales bacterium]|nr:DUF2333 family protein [Desulfobaccales bacterium]
MAAGDQPSQKNLTAPSSGPPPNLIHRILQHRFLLVSLVLILFLGGLFTWEYMHRGESPEKLLERMGAAAPSGGHPLSPATPVPQESAAAPAHEAPAPAPAHPAAPSHEAATPGHAKAGAEPSGNPLRGEIFTQALIKIIDDQVNQTWIGWRPNTIVFGKLGLTDNVNSFQLGVLEVARRTVVVLNEQFTRFANTEAFDPRVNEAMNYLMVSPEKYWFPSASGKYREAMVDLKNYIKALQSGQSRFYSRVDHLIVLLNNYRDLLGNNLNHLIKDNEPDGKPVSWFKVDDYFYQAQGVAVAMAEMLEAIQEDFHRELQKKNSHKLLEEAIHALHQAGHMHPWIVTNGAKDGILANHRSNMGGYIAEAEHLINTLQMQLATN